MPSRRAAPRKTARIDNGHKPCDAGEKARDEKIVLDILRWEICRSEDDAGSSLRCEALTLKQCRAAAQLAVNFSQPTGRARMSAGESDPTRREVIIAGAIRSAVSRPMERTEFGQR
jgi:hypothetical protein